MGVYDDLNAEARQQSVDDERRRRAAQTASARPDYGERVAGIRREYPWLTPGAAASLAKAGHDASSRATREAARRAAERKKKRGFGWHSIGDVVGGVGDFVTPERAEDVIGSTIRGTGRGAKATIRVGMTALQTGSELAQAAVRHEARRQTALREKGFNPGAPVMDQELRAQQAAQARLELSGKGPGVRYGTGLNPLAETSGGIAISKLLSGEKVDLGEGFFPGGKVLREQQAAAREQASIPDPTVEGGRSAGTFGRLTAWQITEPGTTAYKWTSGIVDAAYVLKADPGDRVLSELGKLRQGRKLIDPSVAGGIANATRRTAVSDLANAYLDGADGRKVTGWLANESSPYKIFRAMGGKVGADEAADLAKMSDPSDIVDYIRPKLGTSIREKPYVANPLTRGITPVDGFSSYVPEAIRKRIDGVRLLHVMPGRHVDPHDATDVAMNMYRAAHNAKLGEAKAQEYFNLAASARGPIGRFNAVNSIQADIASSLVGPSASAKVKRGLTQMYRGYMEDAAKYYTDDIGNNVPVLGAQIRGQNYALPTPHVWSEYINRAIPLPDARAIRRATSRYGRLLDHAPLDGKNRPVPVALLDFVFQDVWKPLQLIRGAWTVRVVGEEQIRMASIGQKSIINHPIQAIAWAAGRRGKTDVLGAAFDPLDDATDLARALTRRGEQWRDRVMMMGQANIHAGAKGYGEAGANELAKLHSDPITRRLVAGLSDGDGMAAARTGNPLVDVKEWFWSGAGQKFRKEMAEAKGREALATDRGVADDLIDSMMQRVQAKTAGRADLLGVVAVGTLDGVPVFTKTQRGYAASDALKTRLDDLGQQGLAPSTFVGELTRRSRGTLGGDTGADRAVDHLFNVFMSRPTNYLSRSPAFRQFYWQRVEELIPAMDEAAQTALLAQARKAGLDRRVLDRIEATVARKTHGVLSLDDADTYAKAFGLDETKKLLYDLSEKSQLFDITRHIFPFGEAWAEVLKVWSRILANQPQTVRRAQMAINGARGSGFFHPDEHGEEVFSYPATGFLTEQFAGVPAPFTGRVQGLNFFSNNPLMPGFGPMVQIPASYLLPRKSSWNTVRGMVLPFGDETLEGGALETLLPPWLQKFRQAGKTPFGREDERLWANTWMESARYLYNTGKYHNFEQLDAAATKAANRLYALRGMAQFFAPSAPTPQFQARDKDGRLTTAFKLTEEFRKLMDADRKNGTDVAVDTFLATYGPDSLLYMQGKSEGGGPMSAKALDWVNDHQSLVKRYPNAYQFVAPQDEGFNYDAYVQLIRNGTIKPLTQRDFYELANNRVAAMIYRQAQDAVDASPTAEQQQWLREIKSELRQKYPGYDKRPYNDKLVPNQISELEALVREPAVADTPVAKGISRYLHFRQLALEEAKARGRASFASSNDTADLRDWLRQHGAELSSQYRDFESVFSRVFSRELREKEEDE